MHGEGPALVALGIQLDDLEIGVADAQRLEGRDERALGQQALRAADQHVWRHAGCGGCDRHGAKTAMPRRQVASAGHAQNAIFGESDSSRPNRLSLA